MPLDFDRAMRHACAEMTAQQKRIEFFHNKLMDIRDETPWRRGRITRELEYDRAYRKAYKDSKFNDFSGAAERFRHFLQDGVK